MSEEQERKDLYKSTKNDLDKRQLSNSEQFDKAILTLSTAALGFSLAFIKDIVKIAEAKNSEYLLYSWYFFGAAIISTMASFIISNFGIKRRLTDAYEYYINKKEEFLNRTNPFAVATEWLNYFSGFIFVCALLLTIVFVSKNLEFSIKIEKKDVIINKSQIMPELKGEASMSKKDTPQFIIEGSEIPKLQPIERGAPIPNIQPVTTNQTQQTGQQQTSTQSGQDTKKE